MSLLMNKIRGLKRRVVSNKQISERPKPEDYSTLDNPLEVPRQKESYYFALNNLVGKGDSVLDVGCGLGYGINIMSILADSVSGADVDSRSIEHCEKELRGRNPKLKDLVLYDGYNLPFKDNSFDVITSIDVIEHVDDYDRFIKEMLRVARKSVILATPNRLPEYTNPDGTPMNYWHLREWKWKELDKILRKHTDNVAWHFINGSPDGPYNITDKPKPSSLVLLPVIRP